MESRILPGARWKEFPAISAVVLAVLCAYVFYSDGSLHASPPGVLVWHFDQGIANRWGGMYNAFALEPSGARTYLDSSMHRPGANHSLRVSAHREPEGFCGVWLEFYPSSAI